MKNLYEIKDKVAEKFYAIIVAETDADAIRKATILNMGNPFKDVEVIRMGSWNEKTGDIETFGDAKGMKPVIPWSLYKLPETEAEAIEPLGINKKDKKEE